MDPASRAMVRALREYPADVLRRYDAAVDLQNQGEYTQAREIFKELFTRHPAGELADRCLLALAVQADQYDRVDPARTMPIMIGFLRELLRRRPTFARGHYLLGSAYQRLGDSEQALPALQEALRLQHGMIPALVNLGDCYRDLGRLDQARASYQRAGEEPLPPERPWDEWSYSWAGAREAKQKRARALLLLGRWQEGWKACEEWALAQPKFAIQHHGRLDDARRWRGQPLAGRLVVWGGPCGSDTVLRLPGGGGYGDEFMHFRGVPPARDRVGALTLVVRPELLDLLRGQVEGVDVCAYDSALETYECWDSIFTLLDHVSQRDRPHELPGVPYLHARSSLRPLGGALKAGLAWATVDRFRTTQLTDWAPVLSVPGVTFYNLQLPEPYADLAQLRDLGTPVYDLSTELTNWTDTAAALAQLDLVIAIDCGVANLAGAMGRPVWVCLRASAEWRWTLNPTATPWYPGARLFRQPRAREWAPVFAEVAAALRELVEQRGVEAA